MLPILSYQDLKMITEINNALEDLEYKIRYQTLSLSDERFLTALEVFYKNWLKDR